MFNNLIESSSHAKEFKRRGSFLLFTTATYVMLFAITGVVSIYAYDAHLEAQSTEYDIIFVPPPVVEEPPAPVRETAPTSGNSTTQPGRPVRTDRVDSTSNPNNVPKNIGTKASDVPPWKETATIGTYNADPLAPAGSVRGTPGGTGTKPLVDLPDPPPAPEPKKEIPKVVKVSRGVLEGKAVSLVKPNYPALARQIRLNGTVTVQVLIDESGKVLSAQAVSGHPLLIPEAEKAARQTRFKPTTLSDQPVKVSGLITYNFVMN